MEEETLAGGASDPQATAVVGEQRKHQRKGFKVNRLIRATIGGEGTTERHQYFYLVDISEGGLRVNVDDPFDMERTMRLGFTLQYLEIDVLVRPIWQKNLAGGTWTVGLAFHEPTPLQTEQIRAMVDSFSVDGKRQRFRLKALISLAVRKDEGDWFNCLLVDISPAGLRAFWEVELGVGTELDCRIQPDDRTEVEARGEVVWEQQLAPRRWEFGVQFREVADDGAAVIQAFIDSQVGNG